MRGSYKNETNLNPVTFRRDILIYNRVSKSGSSTTQELMRLVTAENKCYFKPERLKMHRNRSRFMMPKQQDDFRKRTLYKYQKPLILTRHVNFIRFDDHDHPLYTNMIREPFQRFKSRYKYSRVKKKFHFKHNLPYIEPMAVANQNFYAWNRKRLENCILNDTDRECNRKNGDTVENQIAYFCGQDYECSLHGSRIALNMAKSNVEKYYPVVGILERMEESLKVMEIMLPEFLSGIVNIYEKHPLKRNKSGKKHGVSNEVKIKMKKNLALEYDFYDFLNQRLTKQVQTLLNEL